MSSYIYAFNCRCQECGQYFVIRDDIRCSTVINLDIEGFEKDGFYDNSLNRVKCEKCNAVFVYETKMVIFSYKERFAIFVNPYSSFESSGTYKAPRNLFPSGFRYREVNYLIEAKEKVRIFNDNLSDYHIELLKLKYFQDDDALPFDEVNIVYQRRQGNMYYFDKFDYNDNQIEQYEIDCKDNYDVTHEETDNWLKVNRLTITKLCKGD